MGQRGPKKKPTSHHRLTGNASHLSKSELNAGPHPNVEVPPCPPWLGAVSKSHWRYITKELPELGMIARVDMGALTLLCISWSDALQLTNRIKKLGGIVNYAAGRNSQNSRITLERNRAIETYIKFLAKFGLSPSDRCRLDIHLTKPADLEEDEFTKFKRKRGL